uniref:Stress-induced protein 1 n=1 Tax=Salmo salar TaxID=8030 RepID=B5X751_SALSA|nr:survival of motor neuron protein-interacting protein 1 [Salmo salar]ACI66671.1 Stress-induced protein 1 [Salmo salar]
MWPIASRNLLIPSYWDDDFADVMDVAFRCPCEDKFFGNLTGTPNDNIFVIKVHVGDYSTKDVKWRVEGNKLKVEGKHIRETKYGVDKSEFTREFDLPANVLQDTLRHYVTSEGVLVIEGKKHIDVRYPFQDRSDKDHFEVVVDVHGFAQDELNVSLHQRTLMIEGSHSLDKKTDKGEKFQSKSFKRVVSMPVDADDSTLDVVIGKDAYLVVKAKRNPKEALKGPTRLSIKHE